MGFYMGAEGWMSAMDELRAKFAARDAALRDIEDASLQLAQDLKYPVNARGDVLDMNHLPDVSVTLVYHLIRCGWRPQQEKRLIKQRKVSGPGYYEDLVAYVGVNDPDDPVHLDAPPVSEPWKTGPPEVNVIDEERPTE